MLQKGRGFKEIDSPLKVAFSKDVGEIQIRQVAKDRLDQLGVFRFNPNLKQAISKKLKWHKLNNRDAQPIESGAN